MASSGAGRQPRADRLLGLVVAPRARLLPPRREALVLRLPLHGLRRVGAEDKGGGGGEAAPVAKVRAGGALRRVVPLRSVPPDPPVGAAVVAGGQRSAQRLAPGAHHGRGGRRIGQL